MYRVTALPEGIDGYQIHKGAPNVSVRTLPSIRERQNVYIRLRPPGRELPKCLHVLHVLFPSQTEGSLSNTLTAKAVAARILHCVSPVRGVCH